MRCGGNISLPQGLLPPPSSSPTLCPVILLLGALNVQVTKHTLQRGRHGVGGAGRCWRSCFTAQGALQPSQGWSRKQSAPRGICPHPAPGHPETASVPHISCPPSPTWPSPFLGALAYQPRAGVRPVLGSARGSGSLLASPTPPSAPALWVVPLGLQCASQFWVTLSWLEPPTPA